MRPDNVMFREGDKFIWDGELYQSYEAADPQLKEYEANGFQTRSAEDGDELLVYTRRVAPEIALEGEAPLGQREPRARRPVLRSSRWRRSEVDD